MPRLGKPLLAVVLLSGQGCAWIVRDKRIRQPITTDYAVSDPQFRVSASELMGAPLVGGNHVVELLNGDRIFASMLEAIRDARKTITMEKYIWSSGKVSDRFVQALSERARAGVKVHILADGLGSIALKSSDIETMKAAGVEFAKFNPVSFRLFRLNHRTHRKILVVDGRVGFAGGVCISDDWQGDAEPPHWRETHLRIEGPVVGQMQAVFMENWLQARSHVLHGKDYFPEPERAGSMTAQFIKSGPRDGAENARLGFLLSFAAARKNIRIAHAYLAPDTLMIDALLAARKRGVKIEIIVPAKIDNPVLKRASKPRWTKLLAAGVEFFEYLPTLYHCKVAIVDDVWSIVGSVNFDERSMKINDEDNLHVLDSAFASKLIESFEADKSKSRRLTPEDFKKRGPIARFFEHFAGLFRGQL